MVSVYTTSDELIKYEYGYKEGKVGKFFQRIREELPEDIRKEAENYEIVLDQDLKYNSDPFVKRYKVKFKNLPEDKLSLNDYLKEHSLLIQE